MVNSFMQIMHKAVSREVARRLRLEAQLERGFGIAVRREINRTAKDAGAAYVRNGEIGVGFVVDNHRLRIQKLLEAQYERTYRAFGKLEIAKSAKIRMAYKDRFTDFEKRIRDYINKYGADRAVEISETTRKGIRRGINIAQAEGVGQDEIADKIVSSTGGAIASSRAAVIARTETHSAAQTATYDMAETFDDLVKRKRWISVEDSRTRTWHDGMNFQEVEFDEDFAVPNPNGGTDFMSHPADPSAPPEQIINCRCQLSIVVE